MLSVTSSRSLCFTALTASVWNVVSDFQHRYHSVTLYVLSVTSSRSLLFHVNLYEISDFQQIVMFHSVTLYKWVKQIISELTHEMLSVTSNRSLCFTSLICMKCCQWLPADLVFHSVNEMLSVTSSRSLCFTALLCMKCCQWLPADQFHSVTLYKCCQWLPQIVMFHISVWNVVSDFQQIVVFHS